MIGIEHKRKVIIEFYKVVTEVDIQSTDEIPFKVLEILLYVPYPVLAWLPAMSKRIRRGYGRPTIEKDYHISERTARKVCDSFK